MKRVRWRVGLAGLVLVLLSWWQIRASEEGLEITTLSSTATPLTVVAPAMEPESRPVVLVGHGFAGSRQLMRGFALSLAHAGYVVVLWDFDGHGANPEPMPAGMDSGRLIGNAEAALAAAAGAGRVAILGHSMGSGVALAFGQEHPTTAATIAVSPVGTAVTPALPRNLLLMAGSLEAPFVRNAEQRLSEAGGPNGDHAAGAARKLLIIPGVEHISILFSPAAHAAAVDWLDATFGPQPGATAYTDRRIVWWGLGLLGVLACAAALAPLVRGAAPAELEVHPLWRRLAALAAGSLGATILLWITGAVGVKLNGLFGLLVGGYLVVWFGAAGLLSLLLLWVRPRRPSRREVIAGVLAFAALWLGAGLLGHVVWLPWLLIPSRLLLWPLGALLLFPWFMAAGQVMQSAGRAGRAGWWLAQSAVVGLGLLLAVRLSPDLGVLVLMLPAVPLLVGLHALAAGSYRGSWPYALSGALWVSWAFLAIFPLQ